MRIVGAILLLSLSVGCASRIGTPLTNSAVVSNTNFRVVVPEAMVHDASPPTVLAIYCSQSRHVALRRHRLILRLNGHTIYDNEYEAAKFSPAAYLIYNMHLKSGDYELEIVVPHLDSRKVVRFNTEYVREIIFHPFDLQRGVQLSPKITGKF